MRTTIELDCYLVLEYIILKELHGMFKKRDLLYYSASIYEVGKCETDTISAFNSS